MCISLDKIYAEEQITVSSTVKTFTAATYNGTPEKRVPKKATFTIEDDNIRIKFTADPSATVGYLASSGTKVTVTGQRDIENFKCIRQTTDAVINVAYSY